MIPLYMWCTVMKRIWFQIAAPQCCCSPKQLIKKWACILNSHVSLNEMSKGWNLLNATCHLDHVLEDQKTAWVVHGISLQRVPRNPRTMRENMVQNREVGSLPKLPTFQSLLGYWKKAAWEQGIWSYLHMCVVLAFQSWKSFSLKAELWLFPSVWEKEVITWADISLCPWIHSTGIILSFLKLIKCKDNVCMYCKIKVHRK